MIVEYIRYKLADDRRGGFEAAYARAAEPLRASPHCLSYELSRCVEEPDHYILRIEWDSLEGHLEGFRRSPEFRAFLGDIRPYVADIEEMRHYEVTDVRSDGG
jgi:quinol monooxygenase YgiN